MEQVDLSSLAHGIIEVDAKAIAADLELEPAQLLEMLRDGLLTSRCEQGIAEDAGRLRLTFFHADRRLQMVVDEQGHVLQRRSERIRNPVVDKQRGTAP